MDPREITPKFERGDVVTVKGGYGTGAVVIERFYDVDRKEMLYACRGGDTGSTVSALLQEFTLEAKPVKS